MIQKLGIRLEVLRPQENEADKHKTKELIDSFYDVALDAFSKWLPREAIESRTADASCVIALYKDNRVVAYAVNDLLTLAGHEVNYYASGFIRRELQGNGLYSYLNMLRQQLLPADHVMTRTQNPIVYREFKKLCDKLRYTLDPKNGTVSNLAIELAREFTPEVESNMVVRGVYWNRSLMDDTPEPKSELEREVWKNINLNNGDAVILVGSKT